MSSESDVLGKYSARWWINEIEGFEKDARDAFVKDGDGILLRYMDERDDDPLDGSTKSRYNMFWANTQILKSALYAVPPKPSVTREYADAKDDAARVAALMLERILQRGMTKTNSDAHHAFRRSVEDRLLPGLGQVWLRYDPTIVTETINGVKVDVVTKEDVKTDYVNWRDFMWSPARCWDEVWWVARRVWMRKNKFLKRFGKEKGARIWQEIREQSLAKNERTLMQKSFIKGRAEVFEIWCEATGKVYFVARGCDEVIERLDDPLELEEFWPCPPPLLATHTNESLFPRADYTMVRDQYHELDTLNSRIASLTKALRVVGAYDKENAELSKMITGPELAMVAVEKWAVLGEAGGLSKAVDWFPVEQVANVLKELVPMRAAVVAQIYELTSISDIMRGASNPRETAAAQQLKAQYSSVRLQLTQQEVAIFVQNALRLRAEIICRHMEPSTIVEMSQIQQTDTPPELIVKAVTLLKDFDQAQYRIEVSEESLSMADYTAEREMRIELITAIGQFLSQSAQMATSTPQAMPYLLRIVQWVVASFRGSKDIESVLDQAIAQATQQPPQQPQEKPDHSIEVAKIKAQADLEKADKTNRKDLQVERMRGDTLLKVEMLKQNAESGRVVETRMQDLEAIEMETRSKEEQQARELAAKAEQASMEQAEAAHEAEEIQGVKELQEQVAAQAGQLEEVKDLLSQLIKEVSRPRRRIPVRDEQGDIVEVREE